MRPGRKQKRKAGVSGWPGQGQLGMQSGVAGQGNRHQGQGDRGRPGTGSRAGAAGEQARGRGRPSIPTAWGSMKLAGAVACHPSSSPLNWCLSYSVVWTLLKWALGQAGWVER